MGLGILGFSRLQSFGLEPGLGSGQLRFLQDLLAGLLPKPPPPQKKSRQNSGPKPIKGHYSTYFGVQLAHARTRNSHADPTTQVVLVAYF